MQNTEISFILLSRYIMNVVTRLSGCPRTPAASVFTTARRRAAPRPGSAPCSCPGPGPASAARRGWWRPRCTATAAARRTCGWWRTAASWCPATRRTTSRRGAWCPPPPSPRTPRCSCSAPPATASRYSPGTLPASAEVDHAAASIHLTLTMLLSLQMLK